MSLLSRLTDLPDAHAEIYNDFDKRYHQTYMQYMENGIKIPVIYNGKDGKKLIFSKSTGDLIEVNITDDVPIEPFLPEVGFYNICGNPLYLIKNPKRQWKRSFNSSIYMFLSPTASIQSREENRRSWWDYANALMNPEFVKLDEITNKLFANIAIDNSFAISHTKANKPVLIFRRYVVGNLDFNKRELVVTQPRLFQEIQDLFKYSGVRQWNLVQTKTA